MGARILNTSGQISLFSAVLMSGPGTASNYWFEDGRITLDSVPQNYNWEFS